MADFMLGMAFVLMVVGPALVASYLLSRRHDPEN